MKTNSRYLGRRLLKHVAYPTSYPSAMPETDMRSECLEDSLKHTAMANEAFLLGMSVEDYQDLLAIAASMTLE